MSKFYSIRVSSVKKETQDSVSIEFDIPADLRNAFKYHAGQHVTIKKDINGEEVRRTYSLCTAPFENKFRIAVKKVNNGIFSTFANTILKAGDELELMPPSGNFIGTNLNSGGTLYVAFAAGSGITPVISILKQHLYQSSENRFILIYGNKTNDSIIFKEELEGIKNENLSRLSIIHVLSQESLGGPLLEGRIDAQKCDYLFDKIIHANNVDKFYLCGPEEMIFNIKDFLEDIGVTPGKIKFELFTTSRTQKQVEFIPIEKQGNGHISKVEIRLDGGHFNFDLNFQGLSVLDAAIKEGADLPFSCKGGVCSTCKARLIEGKVNMDVNYALEPEELEKGYILTCQSHPTTDHLIIDYDE